MTFMVCAHSAAQAQAGIRCIREPSESDGIEHLIHGARWLRAAGLADNFGGDPRYCDVVRHRLHDDGAGRDAGAMADLDIAENFGPCSDQHAAADLWMSVLVFLASAAESNAMQNRDVVFDHSGFAAHETRSVIEKDAATDPCRGIDVGLKYRR